MLLGMRGVANQQPDPARAGPDPARGGGGAHQRRRRASSKQENGIDALLRPAQLQFEPALVTSGPCQNVMDLRRNLQLPSLHAQARIFTWAGPAVQARPVPGRLPSPVTDLSRSGP